ncbi:MAG: hypothetical protein Q9184_000012 [Pyrenodesmia sp. 2 TL-2023]
MTPVFINPHSLAAADQHSDLLSFSSSCPSLSPSPSPIPRSVVSDESNSDFCDPRDLFVNSPNSSFSTTIADFPPLPSLSPSDDGQRTVLGTESTSSKLNHQFTGCFGSLEGTTLGSLSSFDTFSEFESDNDFITNLSRPSPSEFVAYVGSKRQRLDLLPFEEEDLLSEDSFGDFEDGEQNAFASLPSPPESRRPSEAEPVKMKTKRRNIPKKASTSKVQTAAEAGPVQDTQSSEEGSAGHQQTSGEQQTSTAAESNSGSSDNTAIPSSASTPATGAQPISRRGRKQSLTEDPSKQFQCTLCSRRFRRQEHLKRHYRSLHTHDKPFECNECGKKFSRSDNLSQHARTHGAGSVTLGVLEDGEMPPDENPQSSESGDTGALGAVLFEAAQAAAANASSSSGTESVRDSASPAPSAEDARAMKKRKRDE